VLRRAGPPLAEPISVAQALTRRGLGLRKAHEVLNRLAEGQAVPVRLPAVVDHVDLREELATLGVEALPRSVPDKVDVRLVRESFGLTQLEFATRFGLDPDAVRNWEQGRTRPDRNARVLLRVIETDPSAVDAALV
jgi:DNA-binding transcriptional regulator YiaG